MGFQFPYSYNEHFGEFPDEPKRPDSDNGKYRGFGWVNTEGDINDLIRHVSGTEKNGVIRGGGSIATCSLTSDNRNTKTLRQYSAIALDIDGKKMPTHLKNSLIVTPEEIRERASFGSAIAAMFPTGSAEPEVYSMIGRIIIPLETPILVQGSKDPEAALHKIKCILVGLYKELLSIFPFLHGHEVKKLAASQGFPEASGGIDFAGLTACQYWAGMRPDQQPFYVNDEAFLPDSFTEPLCNLSPEQLEKELSILKKEQVRSGGAPLGSRHSRRVCSADGDDTEYFQYISDQMVEDVEWLLMNILPPPDEGTYDDWFSSVVHFAATHGGYFDEAFCTFCEQSDHRMRVSSTDQMLRNTWHSQGWSKLADALNRHDPEWEETFFKDNGRYPLYSFRRPTSRTHMRPMMLWIARHAT